MNGETKRIARLSSKKQNVETSKALYDRLIHRMHRGWSKEFLMEVLGLTETEYLEIFGIYKEGEAGNE